MKIFSRARTIVYEDITYLIQYQLKMQEKRSRQKLSVALALSFNQASMYDNPYQIKWCYQGDLLPMVTTSEM